MVFEEEEKKVCLKCEWSMTNPTHAQTVLIGAQFIRRSPQVNRLRVGMQADACEHVICRHILPLARPVINFYLSSTLWLWNRITNPPSDSHLTPKENDYFITFRTDIKFLYFITCKWEYVSSKTVNMKFLLHNSCQSTVSCIPIIFRNLKFLTLASTPYSGLPWTWLQNKHK